MRVRIRDEKGYLTIKGPSDSQGLGRYEWEKEIPIQEAQELMRLCEPGMIDKTRYLVKSGRHVFEVDEYYGENEGLTIAEVELLGIDLLDPSVRVMDKELCLEPVKDRIVQIVGHMNVFVSIFVPVAYVHTQFGVLGQIICRAYAHGQDGKEHHGRQKQTQYALFHSCISPFFSL